MFNQDAHQNSRWGQPLDNEGEDLETGQGELRTQQQILWAYVVGLAIRGHFAPHHQGRNISCQEDTC